MPIPELVLRSAAKQLDTLCREALASARSGERPLSWDESLSGLTLWLGPGHREQQGRIPLAQFRYSQELHQWTLHYRDPKERWCFYLNTGATLEFGRLLKAVAADPFGFFWPEVHPPQGRLP
jgi:hypothetical protein